jgi:hypothetical protein
VVYISFAANVYIANDVIKVTPQDVYNLFTAVMTNCTRQLWFVFRDVRFTLKEKLVRKEDGTNYTKKKTK